MKPTRVAEVLKQLLETRWPVFLWGPPGVGKSSVVREVAASAGWNLIDLRASLLDPTDLRGLPAVTDGQAVWYPPSFLPRVPDSKGVLFFDELNAAPPLVQASLYQLTLDRRVGEYVLPEGWRIVAAGNRAEDRSVVFRMPSALANRFIHLDFEVDVADWRAWAQGHGVHPLVVAFLTFKPKLLFEMTDQSRAFATPRSWEMLSAALVRFGHARELDDIAPGIVGEGPAVEFLAYCRSTLTEKLVLAIVADPKNAKLPDDLGALYALVSYLSSWSDRPEVQTAAAVLLNRLNPEIAILLARDLIRSNATFVRQAGYRDFVAKHKEYLV
jgi:MoxR-like ATPase